ncbi:hypothetical protein PBRA_002312 [Plasmodiophora brassicae]|uniref:Protein Asterix n=1 Tax=Plasmodiophora brassicae TaxID=37360 RepID=A0A0G4J3D1_PLABS|nr:hypothetical protein PBRA_002312 [Plasmodiophora brassicae]
MVAAQRGQGDAPTGKLADDPRMPSRITTYKIDQVRDDLSADWPSLLSLVFGISGLTMRIKLLAWASLTSMSSVRAADFDLKQIISSLAFASLSIFFNYFAPAGPLGTVSPT